MLYTDYFKIFLTIEKSLQEYIEQLEYTEKSKNIFSYKLSLLLLQTCPIIESYLVMLACNSETVKSSVLYNWEYSYKLWEKANKKNEVKVKDGKRLISDFPKFAYVAEKIFHLSGQRVTFYPSIFFQNNSQTFEYEPFKTLSNLNDFKEADFTINPNAHFPTGLETPKWWTAYNKIKHEQEVAKERVTYSIAIEAISALFLVLCHCDCDMEALSAEGLLHDGKVKTRLFETIIKV